MGYASEFSGGISIEPPLTWGQIKASDYMPGSRAVRQGGVAVQFELDVTRVDTEEGPLDRTVAVGIVPAREENYSGSTILADLQAIAAVAGPHHVFNGHIERNGADAGDMSRYKIADGQPREYTPGIIWPRESE